MDQVAGPGVVGRSDYGSALAAEAARLPMSLRGQLPVSEGAVLLWDGIVAICHALLHPSDDLDWVQRLTTVLDVKAAAFTPESLEAIRSELERIAADKDAAWFTNLARSDFLKFLEKAVGTAAYHRIRRAVLDDMATVAETIRVGVQLLQPYAQAAEDMIRVLPATNRGDLRSALGAAELVLVKLVIQADLVLEQLLDAAINDEFSDELFTKLPAPTTEELEAVVPKLRAIISDRARQLAAELGSGVSRKIQGARDAISMSADPVSQAANSLIELIDRLLRTAFTDEEVLAWIDDNYPAAKDLKYERGKALVPTKRAQALCFVFGGQPRGTGDDIRETLAEVIVNVRSQLQGLKHADTGEPEELTELGLLMGAVESFFAVGVRLAWSTVPEEALQQLHQRIDPTRLAAAEPHAPERTGTFG
ncbi:hypothetical protein [Kineosporia babensis]|uniref:Uncharacterized protein n=1 Tax=Kineosporia babensis TaxID=499548 RepID=A0A9X1SW72_9ACTN|nr:hypothetical protein [Kineosporia babensis]MCD5309343.1 hypothetical protein [Kineosporia babensis]